jgi:ABC-type sugar transport system permease subunit
MPNTSDPVGGEGAIAAPDGPGGTTTAASSRTDPSATDRAGVARHHDPTRKPAKKLAKKPARKPTKKLGEGRTMVAIFLGPAMLMLLVLVCYPIVYTVWLSLRSSNGASFVGLDNYVRMFTATETRHAITNNIIWVVAAPSIVTALGLIFAVLTERVRRATVLKTILFMPMAISFLAAGVTFRLVYDENPDRGALNAVIVSVHDVFAPPSPYPGVNPRDDSTLTAVDGGFDTVSPVSSGQVATLPLVGLSPDRVPTDAATANAPATGPGLRGVVWLDFTRGGGGKAGAIDPGEVGLPGLTVQALSGGSVVATTQTDATGAFVFAGLTDGRGYTIRLAADNFTEPFAGVTWLGPSLITPAVIGAYIWIWAGFAMVLITAGLAALPREALEAARVDGATEWQTFIRVTVPLVRPVLIVVLVTLTINVLKIFDLVYVLAPESSQDDANVVALEMYRVSFGGGLDYGLGSALAVLLFVLVLPAMLFNIRTLRRAGA